MTVRKTETTGATNAANNMKSYRRQSSKIAEEQGIVINNVRTEEKCVDMLHLKAWKKLPCSSTYCTAGIKLGDHHSSNTTAFTNEDITTEIHDFFEDYFSYLDKSDSSEHWHRLTEALTEQEAFGRFELTTDEVRFGSRMAWRNAPWSVDRVDWKDLHVFDQRHVYDASSMFDALCEHLQYATNNGTIRPTISIFPEHVNGKPDFRVWNRNLIAYAGYQQQDGTIIGDPENVAFTQFCQILGWTSKETAFDVLPLVLNASGEDPKFFEIPEALALRVKLTHPDYPWFKTLGLEWFAVPSMADKALRIAGTTFPAAPISGWYTNAEIGARALSDPHRYNILEKVATNIGLDVSAFTTLWKDEALVEVNYAVLHSFKENGVKILDHHTASDMFVRHYHNEFRLRYGCPADWTKIVPAIGGSLMLVYHQEMLNYSLFPGFESQESALKSHEWISKEAEVAVKGVKRNIRFRAVAKAVALFVGLAHHMRKRRIPATVLYASETGRAESFARRIATKFERAFNVKLLCMKDYDFANLLDEQLVLIVTSTFGSGEAPDNGKKFSQKFEKVVNAMNNNSDLEILPTDATHAGRKLQFGDFNNLRYAVFALGSSAYPDFCQFGKYCDETFDALGAKQLTPLVMADELKGQDGVFRKWSPSIFKNACNSFKIKQVENDDDDAKGQQWPDKTFRLQRRNSVIEQELTQTMNRLHSKQCFPCHVQKRTQLQSSSSSRQTALVELISEDGYDLDYEPGDHLGVLPMNRPEEVRAILCRLPSVTPPDHVTLCVQKTNTSGSWENVGRIPACSLAHAFTQFLDITTPPTQDMLRHFAQFANDDDEKKKLETLAKDDDQYDAWKSFNCPTIAEVLDEFSSVRPNATLLLTQLPLLQPRYYSISSSLDANPGQVHVTIGVVKYQTQDGNGPMHYGVCSNFLNSVSSSTDVICFIRKANSFHLPSDNKAPILMIGPGTGIAPFRSFWQQRMFEKKSNNNDLQGKMIVYFGCRHPDIDNFYDNEVRGYLQDNILTSARVAFSRLPGTPKTYVQHLLKQDADFIYNHLMVENGHVYVCGDTRMAMEVRDIFLDILKTKGEFSDAELKEVTLNLKNENRYHEDIYTVF